jgi:subtilisin family serine protease
MQKYISIACLAFLMAAFPFSALAQDEGEVKFPGGKTFLFRLTLADKNGTPYSLQHPEEFLSEKSLERRRRQGLQLDSTDLPLSPKYLNRIAETKGVEIVSKSKWNNTVLVLVHDRASVRPIHSLSFVKSVERVFTSPDSISAAVRYLVKDDLESHGSSEDNYGEAAENIDLVNGRKLHELGFMGRGMTVAVLDGGFMNVDRIPAMKNVSIEGVKDFVAFKSDDLYMEHDHGTRVLSTMAVNVKGIFIGTAPEAHYWLLRAEDTRTESPAEEDYWSAAAEFADSIGADIISSSLGFQDFDDHSLDHKYHELDGQHALISRTASMLSSKGIIHVNSAGNDGMGTWKKINFPADAHDILAVGAVNSKRINTAFSSVGPSDDGRVKPDVMALGSATATINGRGKINNDMGTSFAAPIIAGMVACLWQTAPQKTATEVMRAVRMSADNYETPNNIFGYGIPDFTKAYNILKEK